MVIHNCALFKNITTIKTVKISIYNCYLKTYNYRQLNLTLVILKIKHIILNFGSLV